MVLLHAHIIWYFVFLKTKIQKDSSVIMIMASFLLHFILLLISALITPSYLQPLPKAFVLPISKDPSTLQYTTQINQRTPLVSIDAVLDLSCQFLWISRGSNYVSSSYKSAICESTQCLLAHHSKTLKCADITICTLKTWNPFSKSVLTGILCQDTLSLQTTDGLNPKSMVSTQFFFSSTSQNLENNTASHGIAGLGLGPLALPTQLASAFNFTRVFAICLPPSTSSALGVMFFGDGPYAFLPGIDVSKLLAYTPLISIPNHKDYLIGITSIQVNGRKVPLNSSLLYTKISLVSPYTTMESSLYKSFKRVFARAAKKGNLTMAESNPPFDLCYRTKTRSGYRSAMPSIDLVMQSKEVFWRVFETNSMEVISDDVACLGFLDGGSKLDGASIVIGGRQLEDNLLQFDLELSRLGFTSTLLFRQTSCANFNFTPNV